MYAGRCRSLSVVLRAGDVRRGGARCARGKPLTIRRASGAAPFQERAVQEHAGGAHHCLPVLSGTECLSRHLRGTPPEVDPAVSLLEDQDVIKDAFLMSVIAVNYR